MMDTNKSMARLTTKGFFLLATIIVFATLAATAYASHSWGNYHWARNSNPFTVKLGDNVGSAWDSQLALASSDWSQSSVLDTTVVTGQSNPKNCRPVAGRVEVCNNRYGNNGWLGIAQIWASGNHITQSTVRLNDSYFNTSKYNTPAWRQFVMCQEIGHAFGLNHQDENFNNANLNTCMDYTSDPTGNQHPNSHDYAQLETIYAHLDSFTTLTASAASKGQSGSAREVYGAEHSEWGRSLRNSEDGKPTLFEKDLGGGNKIFTFVIWAE